MSVRNPNSKKTDAERRAQNKWSAANKIILAAKVSTATGEAFRAWCSARGQTVNAALSSYVADCLRGDADGGAAPAAEIVQAAQPVDGDGLTLPAKVARLAGQAAKMAGDADALTWATRALEAAAGAEIEAQEHRRAALDLLEMARNGGKSAPTSAPSIAPPDKKIARDPGASCMVPGVGAVDWAERTARVRQLREDAGRQKHIAEQPPVENPEPEQTAPGNSGDLLSEQAGPKTPGD